MHKQSQSSLKNQSQKDPPTISRSTSKYHIKCTGQDPGPLPPPALTTKKSKHRKDPHLLSSRCSDNSIPKKSYSEAIDVENLERCPAKDNGYLKLLDVIKKDTPCICKITARAVRSNVHKNLGLTDLKGKIKPDENCSCEGGNTEPGPAN